MSRDVTIDFDTGVCTKTGCAGGHERGKCRGHQSSGTGIACRKHPVRGAVVCERHGATGPQVRHAARLRLLEAADSVAAELVHLATNRDIPPAVRRQAASDLLDRAGPAARQVVEISTPEASTQVEAAVDELWKLLQEQQVAAGDDD